MSEHCLRHTVCICDESDVTTSFQLRCPFHAPSPSSPMFPYCPFNILNSRVLRVSRQSAVGHDYQSKLSKHCSQTDTSKGFGGKFGVQADRVDQVFPVVVHSARSISSTLNMIFVHV